MWQSYTLWTILRNMLHEVSESPEAEARELLIAATGVHPFQQPHHPIPQEAISRLHHWVSLRKKGIPLAYITGERAFLGLVFRVRPGVFIPRPDSEALVLQAEELLKHHPAPHILDLGTGSGVLLLTLLHRLQRGRGVGVDRSLIALRTARDNARRLGLQARTRWPHCRAERLPFQQVSFDLILANPPYVAGTHEMQGTDWKAEPPEALFAEEEGMAATRRWFQAAWPHLSAGGWILMESSAMRKHAVDQWLISQGLQPHWFRDTTGQWRGWGVQRPQEEGVP
ncbi:MAG: peptide chain release factor N(5)-glutamine methyltransferase [Candidatus Hydrothermae bacterium]|nr:peptide chain release factor N(5)-glutamine methyltransferase [Candidatus Hydrothermae bacterium]